MKARGVGPAVTHDPSQRRLGIERSIPAVRTQGFDGAPLRFERPIKGPTVPGGRDHDRRTIVRERSGEEAGDHRDELAVVVVDADTKLIGPAGLGGSHNHGVGYPAAPSAEPWDRTPAQLTMRLPPPPRGTHGCQRMREQSRHLHLADADLLGNLRLRQAAARIAARR